MKSRQPLPEKKVISQRICCNLQGLFRKSELCAQTNHKKRAMHKQSSILPFQRKDFLLSSSWLLYSKYLEALQANDHTVCQHTLNKRLVKSFIYISTELT